MIERVGIWELCGKVRVLNIGVREGWDRMGGLGIKYIISMSVHRRSKQLVFNDYNEIVEYIFKALDAYQQTQPPNDPPTQRHVHPQSHPSPSPIPSSCVHPNPPRSHQQSKQQEPSPKKPFQRTPKTNSIDIKPLYQRAQEIVETRRKKQLYEHIQKMYKEDRERETPEHSKSHSRSHSKSSNKAMRVRNNPEAEQKGREQQKSRVVTKIIKEEMKNTPKFSPNKFFVSDRSKSKSSNQLRQHPKPQPRQFPTHKSSMRVIRPQPSPIKTSYFVSPRKQTRRSPSKSPVRHLQSHYQKRNVTHEELAEVFARTRAKMGRVESDL